MSDGCEDVTLTFADLMLPEGYSAFEDDHQPGIILAMRLKNARSQDGAIAVQPGRAGVIEVVQQLISGKRNFGINPLAWSHAAQ